MLIIGGMKLSIKIALVGNPNSGKTTLFNALTGSNQFVGNWPGVTVEKKEGKLKKRTDVTITDLPGIYSLSPYTLEEVVARNYLITERPDAILNIVDGTNLERQLYLTLQLCTLGRPMAIGVNMADMMEKNGILFDYGKLGRLLGNVPVVPISAKSGEGVERLLEATAFAAIRGTDGLVSLPEKDFSNKSPYQRIEEILEEAAVQKPAVTDEKFLQKGFAADRVLLAPVGGFFAMGAVLAAVFYLTFGHPGKLCGAALERLLQLVSSAAGQIMTAISAPAWAQSLLTEGILAGVFGVLGFLPQLMILYTAIAVLEDSGVMARFSFLADPFLKHLGVSGKAAIPFLMGFGCTVPALTATRILDSSRERFTAQCMLPFLACSARIPIYFYICERFFSALSLPVSVLLYIPGIAAAVVAGLLLKRSAGTKKGETDRAPFVLELPCYRMPSVKSVAVKVWVRIKHFLTKAATVILLLSMLLWFLQSFSPSLRYLDGAFEKSILAAFGRLIAPLFKPIGFGCAEAAVSLLTGLAAKEAVVSSLSIFESSGFLIGSALTKAGAASFLCFTAMYTPCIAAVSSLKEEMGNMKRTAALLTVQFLTAYAVSGVVYLVMTVLF